MKRLLFIFLSLLFTYVPCIEAAPDIEVLSWKPRIFKIRNFLTEEECDYLITQSTPHLARSKVVNSDTPDLLDSNARTSTSMFFPIVHSDPILSAIEERISLVTLIPNDNGEGIQVVHYQTGGEYRPHYDYFDPRHPGSIAHIRRGGQRVASFLMYLNTPEEGGETFFPKQSIYMKAVKGDALLFYDCTVDGKVDPLTLHGGAPVLKGEKWLATKWLRQFPFDR